MNQSERRDSTRSKLEKCLPNRLYSHHARARGLQGLDRLLSMVCYSAGHSATGTHPRLPLPITAHMSLRRKLCVHTVTSFDRLRVLIPPRRRHRHRHVGELAPNARFVLWSRHWRMRAAAPCPGGDACSAGRRRRRAAPRQGGPPGFGNADRQNLRGVSAGVSPVWRRDADHRLYHRRRSDPRDPRPSGRSGLDAVSPVGARADTVGVVGRWRYHIRACCSNQWVTEEKWMIGCRRGDHSRMAIECSIRRY